MGPTHRGVRNPGALGARPGVRSHAVLVRVVGQASHTCGGVDRVRVAAFGRLGRALEAVDAAPGVVHGRARHARPARVGSVGVVVEQVCVRGRNASV